MKAVVRNELSGEEHTVEASKLIKVDERIETFRYFNKSFWSVGDIAFFKWGDQKSTKRRLYYEVVIIYKIENQLANVRSFWLRGDDEDLKVTRVGVHESELIPLQPYHLDFKGFLVQYQQKIENGEFPELWSYDNNPDNNILAQFTSKGYPIATINASYSLPLRSKRFQEEALKIIDRTFLELPDEIQREKIKQFSNPNQERLGDDDIHRIAFQTLRDDENISKRTRMYGVLYQIEQTKAKDVIKKLETEAELSEIQQKRLRDAKGLVKQYEMLKHDVQADFMEQAKANLGDKATPEQIEAERKKLWFTEPLAEKVPQFPGITAAKSGSTMMYVGVGIAAVAVVGFFLLRK